MVIFDPAALPDDFDQKQRDDPLAQLEELAQAGRLYWLDTHADGAYALGVYVGDRLPDRLQALGKKLGASESFQIPSGRLFFTGIEYVFRTDDSFLRKHPHMGSSLELAAGSYRADFFEFEYPEDFYEDFLRERLSALELRTYRFMNILAPLGCISLLALFAALGFLSWYVWAVTVLPCGLLLIALPLIVSRLPAYRKADAVYKEVQKEFPGYGILLCPFRQGGEPP